MILLGDIVSRGSTADFQDLEESILFDQDYPIFNAVGNHDVEKDRQNINGSQPI